MNRFDFIMCVVSSIGLAYAINLALDFPLSVPFISGSIVAVLLAEATKGSDNAVYRKVKL